MENPWNNLPAGPPLVLPEDKDAITAFNARWIGTLYEIQLGEIPSPYIGNPESPVVLLNLNPGHAPGDTQNFALPRYREIARSNLHHQFYEYPYYVLDPALEGTPSGYAWFMQKLGPLIRASGMNAREISKYLFTVEYFPYGSVKFGWRGGGRTCMYTKRVIP